MKAVDLLKTVLDFSAKARDFLLSDLGDDYNAALRKHDRFL